MREGQSCRRANRRTRRAPDRGQNNRTAVERGHVLRQSFFCAGGVARPFLLTCGANAAGRCRGGLCSPRMWGTGRGTLPRGPGSPPGGEGRGGWHPPGGAAARAWAFSGESPNERAPGGCGPLDPRRGRRSSLPLVGFWVCDRRGGRGFMTHGGLSTDLVLFRFWCQEIKRLDFLRWTKTNWFSLLAQMLLPYFNLNRTMNIFILSDTNFCQMFHLRIERTMILFCNVRKFLQGFFFKANTCLNFICGHGITSLLFCYYFTLFSLAYPVT